ncbi:MAG TPA: GNAT family N-acetyltransferase [Herpetosiphonaceae bacterium]|nr:GNAT family N-acetyltransferase [Herpetosiphonaceae bacterium]
MFTSRPYAGQRDLETLSTFLSQARSDIDRAHHLHAGDLVWQLFHMQAGFALSEIVHLWEDANGTLLGFVLLYPALGFFDLEVQAQHRGRALEEAMLRWAETHLRAPQGGDGALYTLVHEHDASRIKLLTEHGYTRGEPWLYLQRSLTEAIPTPRLPAAFRVRHVQDASEAGARAAVLAAAFGAPAQTERYRQLMQAPGYNIELDLVAVGPDGRFGAFALCWIDPVKKVGQFEPVGTAPDFRRMGLGRAVLLEGMRQMQVRGAESVVVIVEEAEEAARALYESVELKPCWRLFLYSKGR